MQALCSTIGMPGSSPGMTKHVIRMERWRNRVLAGSCGPDFVSLNPTDFADGGTVPVRNP
jgi:hypothetical protein